MPKTFYLSGRAADFNIIYSNFNKIDLADLLGLQAKFDIRILELKDNSTSAGSP